MMSRRFRNIPNGSLEINNKASLKIQPLICIRAEIFSTDRIGFNQMINSLFFLSLFLLICRPAAGQDPRREMSSTVENLCPILAANSDNLSAVEKDLLKECGLVKIHTADGQTYDDLSSDQLNALSNMTGDEASVTETVSVELSGPQQQVLSSRLQALRKGSGGGLAMNSDPKQPEPIYLAGPITALSASDLDQSTLSDNGRLGLFITGSFADGEKKDSVVEPGFDYTNTAVTAGMDYRFTDQWIAGLAVGYSAANADLNADSGDSDITGYAVSLYGTYYLEQLYLNGMVTTGWRDYESKRHLNYTITPDPGAPSGPGNPQTAVDQTFKGDSNATEFSANLGGGYDFNIGGLTFGPYANANYFKSSIDGFSENLATENTNDGFGLALSYDKQDVESFTTNVGAMMSYAISTGVGIFSPHIRGDWEHEYNDEADDIKAKFVNGGSFQEAIANNVIIIPTENPDTDLYNVSLGVAGTFPYGISAFVDYTTILGLKDFTYHQVGGGLRFEF
jgi:outer membrane lipase/esterase